MVPTRELQAPLSMASNPTWRFWLGVEPIPIDVLRRLERPVDGDQRERRLGGRFVGFIRAVGKRDAWNRTQRNDKQHKAREAHVLCLGVAPRFLDPTPVYVVRTGPSIRPVAASRTDAPILSRAPPNSRFAWKAEAGAALLRCPQRCLSTAAAFVVS